LIELIRSVETKKVKNGFQEKLKKDAEMIRSDEKMYVSADKTTFTSLIREGSRKKNPEKVWSFAKPPSDSPPQFGLFSVKKFDPHFFC